ncbi:MAG: GlsB/YeaQ/YmgE family stress response membrane protein [Acidobacteria bacterium]|nr:GlsB/YeaQ/YmgE family stress response membrane protein [Acidobacteriota bacterium]
MTIESFIILLLVAGVIGAIGQKLTGYSRGGCLTSIALGFIGALLGSWAVKQFNLPEIYTLKVAHTSFPIIWAIIGAAVFVGVLGLLTRRRML